MQPPKRALDGIKVVELGQLIAGPFAGTLLAYHGADVIKVEPLGGDPLRRWRAMEEGTSLWWRSLARNKRCTAIDLHQPEGQALVRRLIARADVLIENFRPGTLEKWQLSPEQLRRDNPRLVVARVSGYGQTGPHAQRPGYASACEAFGGFRQLNGMPGGPPIRPNLSLGDSLAGLHAAMGIMLALYERDRPQGAAAADSPTSPNATSDTTPPSPGASATDTLTPRPGQLIDCAIYESVFNMLESVVPEYDRLGIVRQPSGTTITGVVPSGSYHASDGKYVVIGANTEPVFRRLCHCMGQPQLADDARFSDNASRVRHQKAIDEAISAWVASQRASAVVAQLIEAAVPCSTIYDVADMMADPHYQARGMFESVTLNDRPLKLPAITPKLQRTPGRTDWAGPDHGAHTDAIMAQLGLTPEQVEALRASGVVA